MSVPAGSDLILRLKPDVVGRINVGPIPCPLWIWTGSLKNQIFGLRSPTRETIRQPFILPEELSSVRSLTGSVWAQIRHPARESHRTVAFVSSLGGIPPELAICLATGNVARAHHLDSGFIEPEKPAGLVIMGRTQECQAKDELGVLSIGDLFGVSMVIIDGKIVIRGRSF